MEKMKCKWLQDTLDLLRSFDYNKSELCRMASVELEGTNIQLRWFYQLIDGNIPDPSINKIFALYSAAKKLKRRKY